MNVHHAKWLYYSNGNTTQGADLKALCNVFGFQQLVRGPTRGEYLLDLFLTDIPGSKTFVGPQVADHHMVIADVPAPKVSTLQVVRRGLDLK